MSSRQQLLEAAAQMGLPAGEADAWLGSHEAQQAVAEEDREAKDRQAEHAVLSSELWGSPAVLPGSDAVALDAKSYHSLGANHSSEPAVPSL